MPFFAMFETEIVKQLKIDNRPKDILNGEDTCFEWYEKFSKSNMNGIVGRLGKVPQAQAVPRFRLMPTWAGLLLFTEQ